MLTREQAIDVLTYAASYDNRKPNAAAVAAWIQASDAGRWDFDEAVEAITQHYANTTEHLMPGHVTAYVKAKRSQPPPAEQLAKALPSVPAASQDHIDETRAGLAEKLGWREDGAHRAAIQTVCPVEGCHSRPGEQCTRPTRYAESGRETRLSVHPSRVDAAHAAAQEAAAAAGVPAPRPAPDGPDPTHSGPHTGTQAPHRQETHA